jgi:TolB-like protein
MRLVRSILMLALFAPIAAPLQAQRGGDPIAKLEAARAKNPQNVAALRGLGIAYYKAKRFADAHTVLDQARRIDPKDGVTSLYAGLAAEETGDLTSARAAYESYMVNGRTRRVRNDIRGRLVALARREAIASAKAAVANEATISRTPGSPLTVAVPPLTFSGADSTLKPLERGMADLLITDLSRSARLTVVERDRMQALTDEIQLSQSANVDAATAVRAGKLIQAGTLVNGLILQPAPNQLTLDARLVNVGTGAIGNATQVNNSLDALFAMEKQLVLQLFDRLGVQLTPAERQLVDRRPTANLNAFLAYSRGLQATDDGRFEDATRFFDNARSLDPGFGAATTRFQAAQAATQAAQVSAATIQSNLGSGVEGRIVQAAAIGNVTLDTRLSTTLMNVTQAVNPPSVTAVAGTETTPISVTPVRDATTTVTGTDTPNRTGQVIIVIRRP